MAGRMKPRLTYANVVATLALFIALGGSSYAALKLPRNSVGSPQIRARAVGSSELAPRSVTSRTINNGSVGIDDVSTRAKAALRGRQGPVGPQGAPGASGVTFSAAVNTLPHKSRGTALGVNRAAGTNEYIVEFPRNVDDCVSTATLATVEGGIPVDPPAGRITVAHTSGNITIRTFDAIGSAAALPFNILVAC